MSAVPTTAAQNAARSLTLSRTLARRLALPLPLRRRRELPRLAVHGPPDADDLRRRAPLREAVAVDRRRTRALDPGRAVLLPRPARAARPVARLAAQLDDRRVHRREDSERDRHVRGRLPRLLDRAPRRPAFLRAPHRRCDRCDAGHGLPLVPHVGGARVPGLPRRRRRPRQSARRTFAPDGVRRSRDLPRRRRHSRAVPDPPRRVPRGDRALRPGRLSPACAAGGARFGARRRAAPDPRRPRHLRRRDSPAPGDRPTGSLAA